MQVHSLHCRKYPASLDLHAAICRLFRSKPLLTISPLYRPQPLTICVALKHAALAWWPGTCKGAALRWMW